MANKNNEYFTNEKHKQTVLELAKHGIPQDIISDSIGISTDTMIKYYGDVWREGRAHAITGAGKKLYEKVKEGDNASLFFYLKTQAGYKETNVEEKRFVDKEGEDLHNKDLEVLKNAGFKTDD